MLLCFTLYSVIFIPIVFGNNTKVPGDHSLTDSFLLTKVTDKVHPDAAKQNVPKKTSKEEPISKSPLPLIAQNEQHAILLNLDKELAPQKDKVPGPSESKIKPRKGAIYNVDNETVAEDNRNVEIKKLTDIKDPHTVDPHSKHSKMTEKLSLSKVNTTSHPISDILNHTVPSQEPRENITKPKKPLILQSDALDRIVFSSNNLKLMASSSVKSVVSDQIPSPGKRKESVNSNSHPGMVMPVIITILVVPMFAVLGYMALKRGKEAWKNRHYKRMDFLLDGMYNE